MTQKASITDRLMRMGYWCQMYFVQHMDASEQQGLAEFNRTHPDERKLSDEQKRAVAHEAYLALHKEKQDANTTAR